MSRSLGQIQQDITALEENVTAVSLELRNLYEQYLNILSEFLPKQLINSYWLGE